MLYAGMMQFTERHRHRHRRSRDSRTTGNVMATEDALLGYTGRRSC